MKRIILLMTAMIFMSTVAFSAKKLSSSQSVKINAPTEKVWAVLIDPNNWPKDNPAVHKAKLVSGDGESVGSVIKFMPVVGGKKTHATLTITISEKNRKIEYEVKLHGGKAVMGFELSAQNGTTVLTNYEKAEGLILRFISQQDMDEEHRLWAESVKRRAEGL